MCLSEFGSNSQYTINLTVKLIHFTVQSNLIVYMHHHSFVDEDLANAIPCLL